MEFRYRGFRVVAIYKDRMIHASKTGKGVDIIPGYTCHVYAYIGLPFERSVAFVELCVGYEVKDESDSALIDSMKEYIDKDLYKLDLIRKDKTYLRQKQILKRSLNELDEYECGVELYRMFKDKLGLTEKEIFDYGFAELVPYFDREQYAGCIAKELTDIGTLRTETGCWFFKFSEVSRLFGVQLPFDTEMLSLIKESFDTRIVTDTDFSNGIFLTFDIAYCPRIKNDEVCYDEAA